MDDDDLRWRIAVHEASHCVIARLVGLPSGMASAKDEDHAYAEFDRDCGAPSISASAARHLAAPEGHPHLAQYAPTHRRG